MTLTSKLQLILAIAATSLLAQNKTIDVRRSTITIHVGKTGVFSGAGHEHLVQAPISSGTFNDSAKPQVQFKVAAARMQVEPDPKVSAKDQAEIQKDMQEKVLESRRYPEIVFRSTSATKTADGQWKLEGMLTLHGVTKPLIASVERNGDGYAGQAVLKQTAFGIEPISVGGGTVKVKDELEIAFHIVPGGSKRGAPRLPRATN